jgi:hypothetical protein
MRGLVWCVLAVLVVHDVAQGTLSKSDKKAQKSKKKKNETKTWETKSGPLEVSVHSRGLVNRLISGPEEIIANYQAYSNDTFDRNFDSLEVLG